MSTPSPERDQQLRADLASLRIDRTATPAPRRRRRRPRRIAPIVLVLVALAAAGAWMTTRQPPAVRVVYAAVTTPGEAGPIPVLSGSGYVVTGDRYVSIGVRVPGRIERYFVEEGQSIHKGDPLVQIDDRDYRAVVARTEAGLQVARANQALAEADLKRGAALHDQGVISRQELDVFQNKAAVAHATVKQLQAELAEARVNLEYTLLRAPTDGVVLAKLKEVGEIAVPGGFAGSGDLVRLANLTDMRAEVDINEADLNRIHMGQPAQVTPDAYPDAHYEARVVKLYPQVDRQKGTLKVEVHVLQPDDRLLPDMSARITFLADPTTDGHSEKASVLVPAAAMRRDDQGNNFVWVADDGRARRAPVESSGSVGDRARITSGLKGGEALIVGDVLLHDGQRIQLAGKE